MLRKIIPLSTLAVLLMLLHLGTARAQGTGFAVTSPKPGETVSQRSIAIRGTGAPGAKAIWDRGILTSDVVAVVDQGGNWSIPVTLSEGRNEFKLRQENPDAGPITLVITYQPPADGSAISDTRIGIGPFSIDLSDWVLKFMYGAWAAVGGDQIKGLGNQIAALMLTNPDVTIRGGELQPVQNLVDGFLLVALPLLLVMWVPTVWRFCYGRLNDPVGSLTRLTMAILFLGFYRMLFRYAVNGSNALTFSVLDAGTARTGFDEMLRFGAGASLPGLSVIYILMGIVGLVFVLFLGVMRLMAFAYLLLLYVFGPLVIPLWLHPGSASYFDFWWKSVLRVLAWSVVWAVEFKLFGAVLALASTGNIPAGALAPLVGLALLFVMFKTPKAIPGPTPMHGWEMASRQVNAAVIQTVRTKAVQVGSAAVSGGTSAVAGAAGRMGRAVGTAASTRSATNRRTP